MPKSYEDHYVNHKHQKESRRELAAAVKKKAKKAKKPITEARAKNMAASLHEDGFKIAKSSAPGKPVLRKYREIGEEGERQLVTARDKKTNQPKKYKMRKRVVF